MSKKIICKAIIDNAEAKGFILSKAANKDQRLAVLNEYRKEKNALIHSGKYDKLLTPVVMSQVSEWLSDLYTTAKSEI